MKVTVGKRRDNMGDEYLVIKESAGKDFVAGGFRAENPVGGEPQAQRQGNAMMRGYQNRVAHDYLRFAIQRRFVERPTATEMQQWSLREFARIFLTTWRD